ncbi:MAG: hypothetical protein Q9198_001872 [Flavoplaca austrocitrina]
MPAKEQLTWGPGGRWKFTHADIDTLLSTRIPETYPDSYKIIFTMENAYEVLSQHNPNKFFDYPDGRLEEALDDLLRRPQPSIASQRPLQIDDEPQVVKHECIPEVAIKRLYVGLCGGYTNPDIGKSLNELYKRNEHLPEYVKYGVIQKGEVKRMRLYLCLYDNRDYGKWMAMSESENAFKDARKDFEQDLPS